MVSKRLREELWKRRAAGIRQYQVARGAGLSPSVLSLILNGAVAVRDNDARVLRLGELLGLQAEECFEPDTEGVAERTARGSR